MKTVFKEIISMLLIAIAVIIILILIFYDYIKVNTEATSAVSYTRASDVAEVLSEEQTSNQVIASFSKSMYSLDSSDISDYIVNGVIERGKQHPFSNINDETYNGTATKETTNTTSATNTTSTNSTSNTTTVTSTSTNTSEDNSTSAAYFDDGTSK